MNCYDRRLRRTVPVRGSSSNELVSPPQRSRVNGWSLPLHSFQFIAWVVYSYMAIVGFGIYIPLLPYNWKYAGYTVIGVAFVFHFVTHLVAVSIDPADPSIRAKKNYSNPMPVLDKRKHPHVIQNLHCYLCEVDVGPKVKHCSSCNKCISDFDHHCKWLNNCVGGRNYWFFFLTVVSAVFGVLLLVFVILFIFIEHFVNPAELRTAPQFNNIAENSTWLAFLPVAPIETSSVGILVVAFITFMLGVASLLLLGHLLGFHIYLLMKKMSTYEYIVKQRHTQSIRDQDIGATQSTTASGTSLENLPPVESAVDCDAPLSGRASALKYQDKVQVASRLSNGICTETGSFQSGPGDSFYYSPKSASQSLPASVGGENLSDSVGIRESTSEDKVGSAHPDSMEGAPIVQNPLGSTLMQATSAIQPGPADSPSGTTGSDLP